MEVKMNKEIRNYQESMFMGLNLRQCIFSLLAIAVAVGIYFGLGKYCLLYTSPSPRDKRQSRMPSSA